MCSRVHPEIVRGFAKCMAAAAWPVVLFYPWRTDYYANLKTLSFRNFESIIFDQMIPRISNYWTRDEMENLIHPLGGEAVVELVQGNSWHVRILKRT